MTENQPIKSKDLQDFKNLKRALGENVVSEIDLD